MFAPITSCSRPPPPRSRQSSFGGSWPPTISTPRPVRRSTGWSPTWAGCSSCRVRVRPLLTVARVQQVRADSARQGRREARVPDRQLDRDDVQRRNGHRTDVLRCRRTARALRDTPSGSSGGIGTAMATTMFHWSLHPWAMYAVVGLSIAYGSYRKGRKQLFSSAFIPLLGRRAEGRSASSSTSSRSSRRCSGPPPRWVSAHCRSGPASRSSGGCRRSARSCWSPSSPC